VEHFFDQIFPSVANCQLWKILEEALVVTLSTLMMMMTTMKMLLEVNPSSYSKDFSKQVRSKRLRVKGGENLKSERKK